MALFRHHLKISARQSIEKREIETIETHEKIRRGYALAKQPNTKCSEGAAASRLQPRALYACSGGISVSVSSPALKPAVASQVSLATGLSATKKVFQTREPLTFNITSQVPPPGAVLSLADATTETELFSEPVPDLNSQGRRQLLPGFRTLPTASTLIRLAPI